MKEISFHLVVMLKLIPEKNRYMKLITTCLFLMMSSVIFGQQYNIKSFGAKSDGKTIATTAIQAAIDQASKNGGGKVIVPEGIFLSGSIILKSGVELHLNEKAILLGSTNLYDYKSTNRWKSLILANNQDRISITGKGI
ncbi:MAG: hypothetical protein L3J74_07100, partial [Bacteroidales bacterium]|nr:hypothetical protein [Bacteroidales bacterium]